MAKLVDRERLARLAAALDARAKAAVKAEEERAMGVEAGLQSAIDAINNAENGILAQAKAHAEAQDAAQKEVIDGQIADVQGAVDTEKQRAMGVEAGLQNAIDAINNAETGVLKQAKDYTDAREVQIRADIEAVTNDHAGRLQTVEGEMDTAQGDIEGLKAAVEAIKGGDVEVDLKDVDERIAALEADAPVKQAAIEANAAAAKKAQDEVDALELVVAKVREDFEAADDAIEGQMADDKAELEGKINKEAEDRAAAVKEVADELAKQKDAAQEGTLAKKIADEAARAAGEEARIEGLVTAEQGRAEGKEQELAQAIQTEKERAMAKEEELANAIAQEVKDRDQAIEDAIEEVNGAASTLAGRVQANEDAIAVINGEGEGSIKKAIADLVDGAPEATDTLNELAKAIKDNKDVYDGWVVQHEQAMNQMKADLQAEIDADVKVVADDLAQEILDREADVKAEEDRAKGVEENHEGRIAANEAFVAAQPAVDAEQDRRIKALEDANKEGGAMAEAVQAAQAAADAAQEAADNAQEAADAAQADADAIEQRLDAEGGLVDRLEAAEAFVAAQPAKDEAQQNAINNHEERIAANEAFVAAHSHAAMEQGIADNKAAIEKEVEDRDAAIAEALKDYTDTEAMKAMLGNVVSTLALTMEDDKVVLKLGGAEGIALSEVSLDLATDEDIDAIIAGLDAE